MLQSQTIRTAPSTKKSRNLKTLRFKPEIQIQTEVRLLQHFYISSNKLHCLTLKITQPSYKLTSFQPRCNRAQTLCTAKHASPSKVWLTLQLSLRAPKLHSESNQFTGVKKKQEAGSTPSFNIFIVSERMSH